MKHLIAYWLLKLFPRTTDQIIADAVTHYKQTEVIRVIVAGQTVREMTLEQMESVNELNGIPGLTIDLREPWRLQP